jgi:L-2-hydroxycarboxylate dehydrogenase (NAD+)
MQPAISILLFSNFVIYLRRMDKLYSYEQLYNFAKHVFTKIGCTEHDATIATQTLLSADLRGVDSHGIARLSGYVRLWETKRVNAKPDIKIIHETPSTAVVDADAALGLVAAPYAMQVAIDKATQVGTGWVSVQNSNHFGIAGIHAMMALQKDMIGIAMTNAIAVAIPAGNEAAFVADFATTTAANGKLEILQRKNEPLPKGWVQNKDGTESINAHELKEGGALLPLGGNREGSSHKGYMLGSIVDIFSAVLSGANYGPWVPPFPAYIPMPTNMPGKGIGHFFGAMRIDAFRPAADFKTDMDKWIQAFKNADPISESQPVIIPGEPEVAMEKERRANGIPLLGVVVNDLISLGEKFGVGL